MWKNPYSWKEGCCVAISVLAVGAILQMLVGPINWFLISWPLNIILIVILCLLLVALHIIRDHAYAVRWLATSQAAVPAIICSAMLTLIMGITNWTSMLRFWPLILCYLWMVIILGLSVLKRISSIRSWNKSNLVKNISFVSNHLGLLLALVAATAGSADIYRLHLTCEEGKAGWIAVDRERQQVVESPLAIELKQFIFERYSTTNEPKRFASEIIVYSHNEQIAETTVEVNHPVSVNGWKIYQQSFQQKNGCISSILELVRDPWLPAVYTGLIMMVIGAIFLFWKR